MGLGMIRKMILTTTMGFASAGFSLAAPLNEKCPVEGRSVAGKKTSTVTVAFCSKKCKEMFDKQPASYLMELAETKDGFCPMSHKKVDAALTSELVIGTCCGDCKEQFDAAPKKFLGKVK